MKQKIIIALILAALMLTTFTSCGQSDYFNGKSEMDSSISLEDNIADGTSENPSSVAQNRKIIKNVELSVETTDYDKLMSDLEKQIADLGGYVEQSSQRGNRTSAENRSAEMTVRIPCDKADSFSDFVKQNGNLVGKSISTEDVTLKYVDAESRLSAKQAEKQALEALLEKAQSVDEIISVRERLAQVIGEIEAYSSQLKTMDNLVDYTTVTVNITEVRKTTVTEEQSTWQKIGTNMKNSAENVWNGAVALFVFVLGSLPYIAVIAVITVVIILACTRPGKKKKAIAEKNKTTAENDIDNNNKI